jgi:hypothetical protein
VLTKEEHAALLRSFAVDRLLKLVTLEAKRLHDGHVTIVALTTHYQVRLGPSPCLPALLVARMPNAPRCPALPRSKRP